MTASRARSRCSTSSRSSGGEALRAEVAATGARAKRAAQNVEVVGTGASLYRLRMKPATTEGRRSSARIVALLGACLTTNGGCAFLPRPSALRASPTCHAWFEARSGAAYASRVENGRAFRLDGFREEVAHWGRADEILESNWMKMRLAEYGPGRELRFRSPVGLLVQTIVFEGGTTSRIGLDVISYSPSCSDSDAALAISATYLLFTRRS